MFQMMCVRVYRNVRVSFLRLILHYLHFRCKRGKRLAIQLASTSPMAKSILPCGQAKTKKRRARTEGKEIPVSLSLAIPS